MESGPRIPFKNVDEYISLQPEEIRMTLELLRQTIKISAPEAQEVISYQMPGYKFHGVPEKLIAEIVQYAVKENLRKKLTKESFKCKIVK